MSDSDFLDRLVGEWAFEGRSVPDDPQHRHTGTETVSRRGAWTVIDGEDGYRFQLAFDADAGKFVGDFIHWEHPQLWTYDGAVEDGRLHLRSVGPSYDVEGQEAEYDDVFEILSPDERRVTGRLKGEDGNWRDFTVTEYRRKKS